ncbi:lipopolysaccharide/colanic/teichoic acid biosynthesis glycosyltransferase [Pseudonocardia endophytica]|uniref:Lipopolysaccharide/colanic/teichoic acid biosynthesis glycosyltransferase n=1 Tax=Pseudonocardia endophytica TaxID=401976 RepID=A0A4V2PHJ1_PSEEN|nr:lipopolysaccharide/colanic/teichoic acid biosynthesis glycosyltransferase [Pseudonocardia endophytica]
MTAAAPALTSELITIPAQRGPVDEIDTLDSASPARRAGAVYAVLNAVVATLILLAAAPVLLVVALAVKLDGGPVFFRQTRVGEDGREFSMIKFRSMVVDAESKLVALIAQNEGAGPLFKMQRDPRITRVGQFLRKFSLDELPQLFNVVGGTMALVGPRPALPREVALYCPLALRRLAAKPGLTGLWQVSGRSNLSWDESIRLDATYVNTWSPVLDLKILVRTVGAVLRGGGAY